MPTNHNSTQMGPDWPWLLSPARMAAPAGTVGPLKQLQHSAPTAWSQVYLPQAGASCPKHSQNSCPGSLPQTVRRPQPATKEGSRALCHSLPPLQSLRRAPPALAASASTFESSS